MSKATKARRPAAGGRAAQRLTYSQQVSSEFECKVRSALSALENEQRPFGISELLRKAKVNRTTLYTKDQHGSWIHKALIDDIDEAKQRIAKSGELKAKGTRDEADLRKSDLRKKLRVAAGELLRRDAQLKDEAKLRAEAVRSARSRSEDAYVLALAIRSLCLQNGTPEAVVSTISDIERGHLIDIDAAVPKAKALAQELIIHLCVEDNVRRLLRLVPRPG